MLEVVWKTIKIVFYSCMAIVISFIISATCFQAYAKHNVNRYYDIKYIPVKHYSYYKSDLTYKLLTNKGKVITVPDDWVATSVTHKNNFPNKKHPDGSTSMVLKKAKPKRKLPSYVRFMLGQPTNELVITKYKYDE